MAVLKYKNPNYEDGSDLQEWITLNVGTIDTGGSGNLDGYATKKDLDTKVDKVEGKGLSAEDFTTVLKQKLEGLSNYDDTNIIQQLSSKANTSDIPTKVSQLENDSGYITSSGSTTSSSTILSYNEFESWKVSVQTPNARIKISLNGQSSTYPIAEYIKIKNALKTDGSSIHITYSENNNFDIFLNTIKYDGGSNAYGVIHGIVYDTIDDNQLYQISGRFKIIGLASLDSASIDIIVEKESYQPVDIQLITYAKLKSLISANALVIGRKYAITDYSCIYIQPITNIETEVSADDIELIVCTAISNNTLDENVTVKRSDGYAKIIECRYSIDPEVVHWTKGMTSKTPKGVIYHMKDEYENEANYDFKHVKFRRWAITDISANLNAANGSKNNESPYRFKANANASYLGSASNERWRVGSGQDIDEALITNIFAGTWSACTSELSQSGIDGGVPYAFTSTYAKNCHKPYTRTEYTADKYLAWQTDMNGTNGLSYNAYSKYGVGGLSDVTVDTTQYKDVYTFHCNDGDLSEIKNCILNVKLNNLTNGTNEDRSRLPNTCFILSDGLISYTDSVVLENITINTGSDNTFLIRDYSDKKTASLVDIYFNHVKSCLFVVWNWAQVRFNGLYCRYNYINADLEQVTISDSWTYNVIFGRIENVSAGRMQWNLWYNAFQYIQWNNSSSWTTPIDGYKSEYTTLKGFTHANILAPLQYCSFDYHINTNTFRNFYNKGVTMKSNKQGISFGRIAYSVLEYGGSNYYADQILNCYFDSVAFYNDDYKFGNVHGWNPSRNKLPKMEQVYVCGGATGHVVDYNTTIPTSWLNTELHPSNQKMGGKLIIYYDNGAGTYKKTDMFTMLKAHAS